MAARRAGPVAMGGGRWAALLLLAPLAACSPAANPPAATGDVVIGGHRYRLPDEAFADGLVVHGPRHSLLLELPVPVPGGQRVPVQLLLLSPDVPEQLPLGDRVEAYVRDAAQNFSSFGMGGRGTPLAPRRERAPDAPPDLVQVVRHAPKPVDDKEVFVHPPLAAVSEAVQCDRPGPASLLPFCEQVFADPGYGITASYQRDYLAHHRTIRNFVLNYFRAHFGPWQRLIKPRCSSSNAWCYAATPGVRPITSCPPASAILAPGWRVVSRCRTSRQDRWPASTRSRSRDAIAARLERSSTKLDHPQPVRAELVEAPPCLAAGPERTGFRQAQAERWTNKPI